MLHFPHGKEVALATLASQLAKRDSKIVKLDARIDRGFASVAEDIATLATKEQLIALHAQTVAIETELGDTKRHKLVTQMADLEDKVFGTSKTRVAR